MSTRADHAPMFESIRHRLQDYGEQADAWKNDHERAMQCMEFEALLEHGLGLWAQINHLDEKIRLKIFREEVAYRREFDAMLDDFYARWLKPCDKLLEVLGALEREGYTVERADEFRAACRETQGILTDDEEFFSGQELQSLEDRAMDDYRAGRCKPA